MLFCFLSHVHQYLARYSMTSEGLYPVYAIGWIVRGLLKLCRINENSKKYGSLGA